MYSPYGFNPRKCNSASCLSECIERNLSKVITALPTNKTIIEIFEKTITGDFSCVNTRLGFDTEILMPNFTTAEYDKMTINQTFKSYKWKDMKVAYKLKLDDENKYRNWRIITKVLKVDVNNQYANVMTKTLPAGSIKEKPPPTWREFNTLLKKESLEDNNFW